MRATNLRFVGAESHFTVHCVRQSHVGHRAEFAGHHNVLNALAAIAIAAELDVSDQPYGWFAQV